MDFSGAFSKELVSRPEIALHKKERYERDGSIVLH
jgi:hypothetical protein